MKTFTIAGAILASLSVTVAQTQSWEDLEGDGLYIRDLEDHEFDIRDLDNEIETDLFERELLDDEDESQLHVRNQESRNKAILNDIAKTKIEMGAALKELGPKINEAMKKFPITKDTGKAWQQLGTPKRAAKTTGKKAKSKSKQKSQDEKDADLMSEENFWAKRDLASDAMRDNKAESTARCALLVYSFKPMDQLDIQLSSAEQHLKWNQWQYMEWELLTLQAVQMSKMLGTCGASGIEDPNGRLGKVWMAFSSVVAGLAAGARKNQSFPDKKMQQLARDFAGYQNY